jgi:hypothetical protein
MFRVLEKLLVIASDVGNSPAFTISEDILLNHFYLFVFGLFDNAFHGLGCLDQIDRKLSE